MVLGGAGSGWPGLVCAGVFAGQGLYLSRGDRSIGHGKEQLCGRVALEPGEYWVKSADWQRHRRSGIGGSGLRDRPTDLEPMWIRYVGWLRTDENEAALDILAEQRLRFDSAQPWGVKARG
jgi:hypothetical protein